MYIPFHCPGACSQVSIYALEKAGVPYELRLIDLAQGEQTGREFLSLSPLGKVPCLLIDGEPLTETPAILTYVACAYPESALFPSMADPRSLAEIGRGLSFCASTLHPQIRGIANPARLTTGDHAPVREKASLLANISFKEADRQLSDSGWWLPTCSVIDVYLEWAFATACAAGFEGSQFKRLGNLTDRLADQPAYARMKERAAWPH